MFLKKGGWRTHTRQRTTTPALARTATHTNDMARTNLVLALGKLLNPKYEFHDSTLEKPEKPEVVEDDDDTLENPEFVRAESSVRVAVYGSVLQCVAMDNLLALSDDSLATPEFVLSITPPAPSFSSTPSTPVSQFLVNGGRSESLGVSRTEEFLLCNLALADVSSSNSSRGGASELLPAAALQYVCIFVYDVRMYVHVCMKIYVHIDIDVDMYTHIYIYI